MNNTSLLISFIVPVFNIDKYLIHCLDSLLAQELDETNYEILIINDGSTDNSLSICLEYSNKYNNIHTINQINQGVSAARNKGIELAKGNYIAFIDGDDYLSINSISFLFNTIKNINKYDLIKYNYHITNDYNLSFNNANGRITFEGKAYNYLQNNKLERSSVVFFYKKDFLIKHNIRFKHYKYAEDFLFVSTVFLNNPTIIATNYPIYQYVIRNNSACTTKSIAHVRKCFEDHLDVNTHIVGHMNKICLKKTNPNTYNAFKNTLNDSLFDMFTRELLCNYSYKEHKKMTQRLKKLDLLPMQPFGKSLIHKLSRNTINILAYIPILYPTISFLYRYLFYPHLRKYFN